MEVTSTLGEGQRLGSRSSILVTLQRREANVSQASLCVVTVPEDVSGRSGIFKLV